MTNGLRARSSASRRVFRNDASRAWLRSPNRGLDDKTPLDLVVEGRFERVIARLLALAEGATS